MRSFWVWLLFRAWVLGNSHRLSRNQGIRGVDDDRLIPGQAGNHFDLRAEIMADGDSFQFGALSVANGCHLESFRTKYEAVCRHQQGRDCRGKSEMNFRVRAGQQGTSRIIHQDFDKERAR